MYFDFLVTRYCDCVAFFPFVDSALVIFPRPASSFWFIVSVFYLFIVRKQSKNIISSALGIYIDFGWDLI